MEIIVAINVMLMVVALDGVLPKLRTASMKIMKIMYDRTSVNSCAVAFNPTLTRWAEDRVF